MGLRNLLLGAAALSLATTPLLAAPVNPAARLSVAPAARLSVAPAAARASAPKGTSKFESHGFAVIALVSVALLGVLAATNSGSDSP